MSGASVIFFPPVESTLVKSLTDLDNLPEPEVLVAEIIDNLEAGLNSFRQILAVLEEAS